MESTGCGDLPAEHRNSLYMLVIESRVLANANPQDVEPAVKRLAVPGGYNVVLANNEVHSGSVE